jgi:hypothetical protein
MDIWIFIVGLLVLALFVALAVGAVFVIRDTVRQDGNWGINLSRLLRPPPCSKCDEPAPVFRRPANRRQAMWGGWTCRQCGYELDKWGRPVADQPLPAKLAVLDPEDRERTEAPTPSDDRIREGGDEGYRKGRHA